MEPMVISAFVVGMSVAFLISSCKPEERTEAEDAWVIVNELRATDSECRITLFNDEGIWRPEPVKVVVKCDWTCFEEKAFYGMSVVDALKKALQAKGEAK